MKVKTIVLIVLALVCGGSAAVGVNQLRRGAASNVRTKAVVTAAVDAQRGVMMTADMVTVEQWPEKLVPPGVIHKQNEILDRVVLVPLVKGEPVLQSKLASKGSGRGLAAMIPRGMRAFTIRTKHESAGVGGFILPGNRVDVLLNTISNGPNDPTGGGATTTLLQNVEVMAVAQLLDVPDKNKVDPKEMTTVTLLVTPDQAAKLDLGMNKGTLHLALRNPEDEAEADAQPATMTQLRFHQDPLRDLPRIAPPDRRADQLEANNSEVAADVGAKRSARIHTLRGTQRGSIHLEW